ncbi:hypertrehalosaemic prohormone-like [Phymastichus coffea]|uniref:hypertrehalosaemic prohormone-like n=1 Tax=Phymastichus coffea TaxID=108790 RepID=UPI00273BC7A2|nr:hypertrehalosaemic prohormone-like [Phymastichus coffea]
MRRRRGRLRLYKSPGREPLSSTWLVSVSSSALRSLAMSATSPRYLCLLVLLACCAIHFAFAQVTFSKGWGPGKREALNGPECRNNARSLALIFHSLLAELKRSMACDHQAAVNYLQAQIGEH